MKLLSLILACTLFTSPLLSTKSSSGIDNTGPIMFTVFCVLFTCVKAYEWYTEKNTVDPVENIKADAQKSSAPSPAAIPFELSSFNAKPTSELIIEKREENLKNSESSKEETILKKQDAPLPLPSEPALLPPRPQPVAVPVVIPQANKSDIVTPKTQAKTTAATTQKTSSKQDTHKKYASVFDLNDPFNSTK